MTLIILRIKPKLLSKGLWALYSQLAKCLRSTVCFCKKVFWNTTIPFGYPISLATFPPQWQRLSSCDKRPSIPTPSPPQYYYFSGTKFVSPCPSRCASSLRPLPAFPPQGLAFYSCSRLNYSHLRPLYLHRLPRTCFSPLSTCLAPSCHSGLSLQKHSHPKENVPGCVNSNSALQLSSSLLCFTFLHGPYH